MWNLTFERGDLAMPQTSISSIAKLMRDLTVRGENSSEIASLAIDHIFHATQAGMVALAIFTLSSARLFIRTGANMEHGLVDGIRKDMDRFRGRSLPSTGWKSDSIVSSAARKVDRVQDIAEYFEPYGDRIFVNDQTTLILARYYLNRQPTESHQGYMELIKSVLKVFFDKLTLHYKMSSLISDSPRLLSFLANFKGGFVITDQESRISLITLKAGEMFHKRAEELNQCEIGALDCDELSAVYEQACRTGESLERNVTISGSEYCRVFISPIEDINGYKVGWLLLISDATEETRLRRIMVHDLKNQLNPIQALLRDASEIARDISDQKEAGETAGVRLQDKIRQIIINFSRYAEQIDDLNYLEHMKLRRGALKKDTVNLTRIIGDLIHLYESEADAKKVQLKSQLLDGCFLEADEKAISSVFRNLVSNSIEHNEAEGEGWVALEMKMENGNILVTISNTGQLPGEAEMAFKKGEPVSTSGAHGFGLYMAREFVLENGGTIDVDSEIGNGTNILTFTVNLPGGLSKDDPATDEYGKEEISVG